MFSSLHQSSLAQKKTLFQQKIRKQHQKQLFSELREQAHMPEEISRVVSELPHSLLELINIVTEGGRLPDSWTKTISASIFRVLRGKIDWLVTLPPNQCRYLLIVIIGNQEVTSQQFDPIWEKVLAICQSWSVEERKELLRPLSMVIRKIDTKYLQESLALIPTDKIRYDDTILDFYNDILQHCPALAFQFSILNQNIFDKLITHLSMRFYNDGELIKMCQILIQVLYLSNEEEVSKKWRIDKLLKQLEFFIKRAGCNMLVDRALMLIYNVNIDAGSVIFMGHSCVETIADQMVNLDLPLKLRELMGETYLSALANIPKTHLSKAIQNQHELIIELLQKIISEFPQNEYLMNNTQAIMSVMLNYSTEKQILLFRKIVLQNVQFMETMREVDFGRRMIEEWELL